MSLLAQLLVAWFGINLLILALMWHNANERRRRREAYERQRQGALPDTGPGGLLHPAPAEGATPDERSTADGAPPRAEQPRVVVMVNGDTPARRQRPRPPVLHQVRAPEVPLADCDCEALRADIRSLRLSVAELSIDRASLLARLESHRQTRTAPSRRSAASQP